MDQRQRFTVELRPGETTIVSWKKLNKDASRAGLPARPADTPPGAHPSLESRMAPAVPNKIEDNDGKDASAPNRFSAVIEKIERLYMGQHSSDGEDLANVPDDDEYDTEDSFIDDAELDEYFEVDKSTTKHGGFFVNRGKLERIEPSLSPSHAPKKRRRKDLKTHVKDGEPLPKKAAKIGGMRMKAAARGASVAGSKPCGPHSSITLVEQNQEGKSSPNQLNPHLPSSQMRSAHSPVKSESLMETLNRDDVLHPGEGKEVKRQKTGAALFKDMDNKLRATCDYPVPAFGETPSRKLIKDTDEIKLSAKIRQRERNGSSELLDLNPSKSPSVPCKDGSSVRPKGTVLERAIQDLERVVAESRPQTMEVQEIDAASQGVKRRLPQEIKQKLAKVARLAQSSQGRISGELLNRLMGILGHLLQLRTLKRHLKEMVKMGLSAKQRKADKIQQVKKEVIEMINTHAALKYEAAEQHDGSSDDFKEKCCPAEVGSQARYPMDATLEDRILELYELYVEGMDEDRGPQSRKLYMELAELWPNGTIDSNGIKSAVNRARERKKHLYMHHHKGEKIKRSPVAKMEGPSGGRTSLDAHALTSHDPGAREKLASSVIAAHQYHSAVNRSIVASNTHSDKSKIESLGNTISTVDEVIKITDGGVLKKKIKRKPDSAMVEMHDLSTLQHREREKHKSPNPLDNANQNEKPFINNSVFEQPS